MGGGKHDWLGGGGGMTKGEGEIMTIPPWGSEGGGQIEGLVVVCQVSTKH